MERWAIGGDVVLHAMLVGICGLETGNKELGVLIDHGIEGVNAGDVEATNSGALAMQVATTLKLSRLMRCLLDMLTASRLEVKKSAPRMGSLTSST